MFCDMTLPKGTLETGQQNVWPLFLRVLARSGLIVDVIRKREQVNVFYDRDGALKWLGLDTLPR
jgi:hypothetical protein